MSEQEGSLARGTNHLLIKLLREQRKTNQLLMMLIDALAEEADPDDESMTYMDGTPVAQ